MVKTSDVLLILVAILFPPASVAFITGCSCDLLINILLTIMHCWLIYKKMKAEERYGRGGFLYTGNGQYAPLNQGGYNQGYVPGQVNYGATN
ncbi:hypothetical protein SERLADRAFT_365361 [Serpula lacrymans var. lacrymans S7.9]|uniref:Stress response RCI peptide n=1 Tax=Serpula lacrymans var. lacrymans (strain S7.9) TaxID=578457 RepID=F8NGF2_SERL9|nr:uncharacterized protein SERLADRAFT_365361 [Serpula lacrymans var. lacrymans S7.9]EGO29339.1 hypothetical protein SERLADRAFT_365361 [Serpula lacrymans var. lacrymans S7.9]